MCLIESKSNFSSVRASTCVCKGKWMYEILLGSKGIMQLGWATLQCKFTNEEGVGDTPDSFAYDGHRVRKWNVMTGKYGEVQVSVLLKPEKLSAIFGTANTSAPLTCKFFILHLDLKTC
ncbi:PREDICTED: E3 ubiquitin-protein ligase RNF123-like [Acropora digitifera]|uniref:E3 ubiquitin-protein ligase RNF123-like n=1 Tax=Acropora digitifera TaxID=70779 RepID=UPI00077AA94D|nr:PREDICTED: E3 ubiquitin-protein ligase RNF123-like [Acropora digitifera]